METFQSLQGAAAESLLNHRGSMLMLDTLLAADQESAVCQWQVNEACALMVPGKGLPGYAAIECMAQCIAVHAGARARIRGLAPPLGLLLGTRHFHSSVEWLKPGQVLRIECVELIRDNQGMASFDCMVKHQNDLLAQSRLAVFEFEPGPYLHD